MKGAVNSFNIYIDIKRKKAPLLDFFDNSDRYAKQYARVKKRSTLKNVMRSTCIQSDRLIIKKC